MAETTYSYEISTDFPGGAVNTFRLKMEIDDSSISTTLNRINTLGDNIDIIFDDALSAPDKTTLDGDTTGPAGGLIASHDNTIVATSDSPEITWKDTVDTVANSNITLSGEQTINGLLTSSSRVLCIGQTDGTENGIYTTSSGSWTRTTDFDKHGEIRPCNTIFCDNSGSEKDGCQYILDTPGPISVGITSLTFLEIAPTRHKFGSSTHIADTFSNVDSLVSDGLHKSSIEMIIEGGGSVITTGIKGDIELPFTGTITSVRLFADQVGDIVVDIWKDTYDNHPPTDSQTITAAAKPTLSSASKYEDETLTGWTTTFTAGDILRFNVDSVATITRLTLSLSVQRTS